MKLACVRCGRVLALEVDIAEDARTLSGSEENGNIPDEFTVSVPGGTLSVTCISCTTPREALQEMMRLAAKSLEVSENYVEEIEHFGSIMPALLDDPQVKASLATARMQVVEARAQLQALAEAEREIED